jgi:hypothetical protein
MSDACGYFMEGTCTYYQIYCDKVPHEKCVAIKELVELAT